MGGSPNLSGIDTGDPIIDEFRALQAGLRAVWPTMTVRSLPDIDRTIVVVPSVSVDVPAHLSPVIPSYEERYLCLALALLRQPRSRVVYVTSLPVLPRIVDYYVRLVPGVDAAEVGRRLMLVSPVDGNSEPLTAKLLKRPRLLERIRGLIGQPELSMVIPFMTTRLEAELSVALGVPVYGPDPTLEHWGTKSGSRTVFREAGVPLPAGVEGVRTRGDVCDAVGAIRASAPDVRRVVVKLDRGLGGLGNAMVDVAGADDGDELGRRIDALELEDELADRDEFFAALQSGGGVVEARIEGGAIVSPSVQVRVSPDQEVEVLSTHDQVLGGRNGQTFLGCRFPADVAYARDLADAGLAIGRRLAREGVIGRFGIDFVLRQREGRPWEAFAIEVNLRNGGTTHPMLTLQALTDGEYQPEEGEFRDPAGDRKCYVATDHLEHEQYATLTPDDLLDVASEDGLGWDPRRGCGVVFHLIGALAVAGRVGLTAIGNDAAEAEAGYRRAAALVDQTAGVARTAGI